MTLRIIVRTDDANMAANVGGSVLTTYRTFDVELPEVEQFLLSLESRFEHRQVSGVEIVCPDEPAEKVRA